VKTLNVSLSFFEDRPLHVGRLAEHRGALLFEYDSEFVARGLDLSPFKLPLSTRAWRGEPTLFDGLPGVIDDSLPDGWGRLLIDRHFRRAAVAHGQLSPLDRLAYLGSRTMGALTYHPPAGCVEDNQGLDLDLLARESEEVLRGDASEILPQLLRVGGSSGGARPKALVGIRGDAVITGDGPLPADFEPWIVKFRASDDDGEAGAVEYVYSLMAREAGLEMSECRLITTAGGARFFATRRFDRVGPERRHAHSLANLLHTDFRTPAFDYEVLLRVSLKLTHVRESTLRCYRHMIFNVLAWNRDDHAKNFGFIMAPDGGWRASPSYDLMFSGGHRGQHFTTIAGEGQAPDRGHFDRLAQLIGLVPKDRERIEEEVRQAVGKWRGLARAHGISTPTIDRISGYHARAAGAIDAGPKYLKAR